MGGLCGKSSKLHEATNDSAKLGEGVGGPKPSNRALTTNLMRARHDGDVSKHYENDRLLGEGSMGTIRAVKKKSNGQMYALKTIQLSRISPAFLAELRNEIDLLRSLDHPNIIRPLEVFDTKRRINLILELCAGGDLYTRHPYTEEEACSIALQLTSAIAYCHANGVVHRDLKFENIMFASKSKEAKIKVIDFGLSSKYAPGHVLKGSVGTLYSMAPEVIEGASDEASDNWSIGVIAFMLLSSQMPFFGKDERTVIMKIQACAYAFRGPRWKGVSEEAKDFVKRLIVKSKTERMRAADALNHTWLRAFSDARDARELPTPSASAASNSSRKRLEGGGGGEVKFGGPGDSSRDAISELVASMKQFGTYGKLRKAALMVVAHQCDADQLQALSAAFSRIDKANNGQISLEELKGALKECDNPLTDQDVDQLFKELDVDETGLIHYTEFVAATVEAMGHIEVERLEEAFDRLDADDTGYITVENLREILGADFDTETINAMIAEADFKQTGKIDLEEFKMLMTSGSTSTELKKIEGLKENI
uniref:non-specific serine/threonine protein kinase n=1 Tax=Heterosigma akashiwo TaxID=2829 RepID=A0A7S3XSE4_HETAK